MAIEEAKTSVVVATREPGDTTLDSRLRPRTLKEFVGQQKLKESLSIFLAAAAERS